MAFLRLVSPIASVWNLRSGVERMCPCCSHVRLGFNHGLTEQVRLLVCHPSLFCSCPLRYLAWPSLVMSINSVINQHPLRTKEGGNSPISTLV